MGKRKSSVVSVSHAATDDLNLETLLSEVVVPDTDESENDEINVSEGLFEGEVDQPDYDSLDEVVTDTAEVNPLQDLEDALGFSLGTSIDLDEGIAALGPVVTVAESGAEVASVESIEADAPVVNEVEMDPVLVAKRAAKAAAKAKAKLKADGKTAAPKEPKAPKAPKAEKVKVERVFFGKDKVKRLRHSLGTKLGDFMVLTLDDAALDGDDLKAKQDATIAVIAEMGDKVKNRATNLLEFAAGRTVRLNAVINLALTTLAKDGQLTTGDNGNMYKVLIDPKGANYSPASARAMGGNTVRMLNLLKLTEIGPKGVFLPNPNSLLLTFIAEKLSLSFGEQDEGDEVEEEGWAYVSPADAGDVVSVAPTEAALF
jgi:hypothetical protein